MLFGLAGCWDVQELNEIFIVTGMGLDASSESGKIDITIQIADIKGQRSESNTQEKTKNSEVIIIKHSDYTISEAITKINRDSKRRLVLHHIQVLAIGNELARQGIANHLDLFIRDLQTRLETPVVIVDGRADDLMGAKLAQEANSGIFFKNMFEALFKISDKTRERIIDLLASAINPTTEMIVPYVKLLGEEGSQEVRLMGMAVFEQDKMIGDLDIPLMEGYVWAMGKVKKGGLDIVDSKGVAVLHIDTLKTKRKVLVQAKDKIAVNLEVDADLNIRELKGFHELKPEELIPYIIKIAQEQIGAQIDTTFRVAQEFKTDFYQIGTTLNQEHPKVYEKLAEDWHEVFANIDFQVKVTVNLNNTGLILDPFKVREGANNKGDQK